MSNYLVLASMNKPNKALADQLIAGLAKSAVGNVVTIWFDAAYFGAAMTTDKCASEILYTATKGTKTEDLRDILIVELGHDWNARSESKSANWLMTHLGRPRLI